MTNQSVRWQTIITLERKLEVIIDGDLTDGLKMTWNAAEQCVILMYNIFRAAQAPEVKAEFAAMLEKIKKGRDPIEKLVRYEMTNLPPKMRYKVMGVQSQIVAALHLINREIGEEPVPDDAAISFFLNTPAPEGCGGLERCRLRWLHLIAAETRNQRKETPAAVPKRKGRPPHIDTCVARAKEKYPGWPTLKIEGYAQAMLDLR